MITYRLATQPPAEPPVRLYKMIAVTFLAITVILIAAIVFMTAKKATITVVAREDARQVSLAVAVRPTKGGEGIVSGSVSSTVLTLSEKFEPTTAKTSPGIAKGEVVIYNKLSESQTLIKTTRFLSPAGVLFRLSDRVTVPSGGQVTAAVYADQGGAASEIGPTQFTIPGLSAERQKFVYAESLAPMKGGELKTGILTAEDIKAAEGRFKDKVRTAAEAALPPAAPNMDRVITVTDMAVSSNHKVGDEINEFVLTGKATVVVVTYGKQELLELIDRNVAEKVDPAVEKFLMVDSSPRVTVASFDLNKGMAELAVEQKALVTLDAQVETLAPQKFLGKKKAEIERYVLGLDHVALAEVKFSPSWIRSAPSVPDRIKIVVKNVE